MNFTEIILVVISYFILYALGQCVANGFEKMVIFLLVVIVWSVIRD